MKPSLQFETQGILLQLLSRFLDLRNSKARNPVNIPSRILNAMNYVQTHLHLNPTVKELAERANQNEDYFSRQFLLHTGLRPLQYIRNKKIERAQYLITTTDKTFLEIATETGFANLPHFSNTFKKISHLTPGEYRNQSTLVK